MLTNASDPASKAKLAEELRKNPPLARVVALIEEAQEPFAIDPEAGGIEIIPLNEVKQLPNRCRLKLFRPREAKERLCAFFFKRSNFEWSRDRFSYGAVEFEPGQFSEADVRIWIGWLLSGLDPEQRPERLRRAFGYTVPE